MRLNKESRKVCKELFRASFTDKKLDAGKIKTLVNTIAQAKPRHYLDILKNYQRLIRLEAEKTHAVIESATPLESYTSYSITNDLQAKHGSDLTTEFKVSPDLIGGLRIKIGSDVWDGSVRHRLDRLSRQFNEV
jgi:F-type H+-transporting ATPase subunit delta